METAGSFLAFPFVIHPAKKLTQFSMVEDTSEIKAKFTTTPIAKRNGYHK